MISARASEATQVTDVLPNVWGKLWDPASQEFEKLIIISNNKNNNSNNKNNDIIDNNNKRKNGGDQSSGHLRLQRQQ